MEQTNFASLSKKNKEKQSQNIKLSFFARSPKVFLSENKTQANQGKTKPLELDYIANPKAELAISPNKLKLRNLDSQNNAQNPSRSNTKKQSPILKIPGLGDGKDKTTILHKKPRYIKQKSPVYPKRSWELGQQGTVVLRALINKKSQLVKLEIASSSKYKLLDDAAIAAVKEWRFKPEEYKGQVRKGWIKIPLRFVIED